MYVNKEDSKSKVIYHDLVTLHVIISLLIFENLYTS